MMRSYEVHIPESELELKDLVGKVVKYIDSRPIDFPIDLLLFGADGDSIELIGQGETLSHPSYPDHSVISRTIRLEDLTYNSKGLFPERYAGGGNRIKEKTTKYKEGSNYASRQEALAKIGLWLEPN